MTPPAPGDPVRFLVVCGPRTGSNFVCSSLNSHPRVVCFREVFNFLYTDVIDYGVDGYANRDPADLALRARDPVGFLNGRIFAQDPSITTAVGFKYMYDHVWGFPGLLEALQADTQLRIIHLMRRNGVRAFLSYKTAFATGEWQRPRRRPLATRIRHAATHPVASLGDQAAKAWRRLFSTSAITLDPKECLEYIRTRDEQHDHFRRVFAGHPMIDVFYEDLLASSEEQFALLQQFVGVKPARLRAAVEKQNPGKLRDLIRNYGELERALAPTPYAWMMSGQ